MRSERRWTLVPQSTAGCVLLLLLGIALTIYNIWQLARADEIAILPVIATILGVVIIGTAIAGLASPRLRSR